MAEGYYSGLLEGKTKLDEMSRLDSEAASQNAQRNAQTQAVNFKLQQDQKDAADQDRISKILSDASDATQYQSDGQAYQDTNDSLTDTLIKSAKSIMGIDPKMGLDYLKQAAAAQKDANENRYKVAQTQRYQLAISNDLFAQAATDGSDWGDVQTQLAQVGVVVPPQYQTWNSDTAKWVQRRVMMSKALNTGLKAQAEITQLSSKTNENNANTAKDNAETKAIDAKTAKTQQNIKPTAPLSGKSLEATVGDLSADPRFDGLEGRTKLQASQDYQSRVNDNMGNGMTQSAAQQEARNAIMKGITTGGFFDKNTYASPTPVTRLNAPSSTATSTNYTIKGQALKVGDVHGGYVYKGGDAKNPSSWAKK